MDEPFDWLLGPQPPSRSQQPTAAPAPPNIADPYADVLRFLDEPRRRGVITLLAVGFYDGWRPTHHEVAQIVRSHCTGEARRSLDRYLRSRPDAPTGEPVSAARTSAQP